MILLSPYFLDFLGRPRFLGGALPPTQASFIVGVFLLSAFSFPDLSLALR